jgi:hypothetical protein
MLFEGLKEKGSMVIVPSSALESMKLGAIGGLASLATTNRISDPRALELWPGCTSGAVPAGAARPEPMRLSPPDSDAPPRSSPICGEKLPPPPPPPPTDQPVRPHFPCNPKVGMLVF